MVLLSYSPALRLLEQNEIQSLENVCKKHELRHTFLYLYELFADFPVKQTKQDDMNGVCKIIAKRFTIWNQRVALNK